MSPCTNLQISLTSSSVNNVDNLGFHPDSVKLYENKLNISLTPQGFIECLIKSEGGLLPLRVFFKNSTSNIKNPSLEVDYQISLKIILLFLELCEKAKTDLVVN